MIGTDEQVRDLTVGSATAGGSTVRTALATQLYDFLEVYAGLRQTNVTVNNNYYGRFNNNNLNRTANNTYLGANNNNRLGDE